MKPGKLASLLAVYALGWFVVSTVAAARGPSTEEERRQFVEATRSLEKAPLAEGAQEKRKALFKWIVEVPDIQAKMCTDLLGAAHNKYRYAQETAVHQVLASAAFVIEYPARAKDDAAMYLASVEDTLRAYSALLKARPDARAAGLDALLAMRERGELAAYIAKTAKQTCKEQQS
jgi:hypothetical protein